jgi:hypothetical protein
MARYRISATEVFFESRNEEILRLFLSNELKL